MKFPTIAAGLCGAALAAESSPFSLFSHDGAEAAARIPTSYESAVMGRRILALSKLGDLATVFPDGAGSSEHRPNGMGGVPVGLMDYVAECEDDGNPTLLAIKIATSFKNVEAGSNITVSMRWIPPYPPTRRMSLTSRLSAYVPFLSGGRAEEPSLYNSRAAEAAPDPVPYSAANLPRFSLFGHLEPINPDPLKSVRLAACFTAKHHDAKWWLPGNAIHESSWARLVVTHVYWVGGFGDRAYIGWIPLEEWQSVTRDEWSKIKLPGEEKGWSEWSVGPVAEL